eukprot:scaffold4536_cov113-Isochrysis_galbana.AAC.6
MPQTSMGVTREIPSRRRRDGARARTHRPHQLGSVLRSRVVVIRADAVGAERLSEPLDCSPVELKTRAHNQPVVAEARGVTRTGVADRAAGWLGAQMQRIRRRVEAPDWPTDPLHSWRQYARHRTAAGCGVVAIGPNQRPRGLIAVRLGGLDESNTE